ncbi:MAG: hypothetical protein U1E65_15245 [Myxococcota bacterium]
MTQTFGLFNNFNLWKTLAPKSYGDSTNAMYNAFGYASPDQMRNFMQAQGGQLKSYNDLLSANQNAMRRANLLNSTPPELRENLANGNTHMVGNTMVMLGKDGNSLAIHGASLAENYGALATLRAKFPDGSAQATTIDENMERMKAELLRRQGVSTPAPAKTQTA